MELKNFYFKFDTCSNIALFNKLHVCFLATICTQIDTELHENYAFYRLPLHYEFTLLQWCSQTRTHPGPDLCLSYDHGRFPRHIWLTVVYSTETYVINFKKFKTKIWTCPAQLPFLNPNLPLVQINDLSQSQ